LLATGVLLLVGFGGSARAGRAIIAPCEDRTGTALGRRATATLHRELRSLGVSFLRQGPQWQKASFRCSLRQPARVRKISRKYRLSGLIRSVAWKNKRGYTLVFLLVDPDGKVSIRSKMRLKKAHAPKKRILQVAKAMAGKLRAKAPRPETAKKIQTLGKAPAGSRAHVQTSVPDRIVPDRILPGDQILLQPEKQKLGDKLSAEVTMRTMVSDNVFLNRKSSGDIVMRPAAKLAVDFGQMWSAGYSGEVNIYQQRDELLSSWHEVYLFVNPAWGEHRENQLVVESSFGMLKNQREFSPFDYLQGKGSIRLNFSPWRWLSWGVWGTGAYRFFDYDRSSCSIDSWAGGWLSLALGSKTRLAPRAKYGFRHYTQPETSISQDQQYELGLQFTQALWPWAGMRLDYAYVSALGNSGMIEHMVTQQQASYLGWDFLFSGHQARLDIKQILGKHVSLGSGLSFSERKYAGWPAYDDLGTALEKNRRDLVLSAAGNLGLVWKFARGQRGSPAHQIGASFEYRYIRQWSNSQWFDTVAHAGSVALWASW